MDHEELHQEELVQQEPETVTSPTPETLPTSEHESQEPQVAEAPEAEKPETEVVTEVQADEQQEEKDDAKADEQQKEKELDFNDMSEEQLIEQLRDVIEHKSDDMRRKVEALQGRLWKLINAAQEKARELFAQTAQEGQEFVREASQTEIQLRELLQKYKAIREEERKKLEEERAQNLERKLAIIEQMKQLAETEGDALSKLDIYKQLQQEWKQIGPVPAERQSELWTNFNHYQECFYDQVKMSHELRDYDFRKNLELKNELIEAARKLAENPDILSAARQLQQLHDQWKQIGPVAREIREDIWNQFKEITASINRRHQAYFDELHKKEEENFRLKEQLCQRVELIDIENIESVQRWLELTEEVQSIQQEWKTIGFASRKLNDQIYDRFRAACNRFFDAKNAALNEQRKENAEKVGMKRKLIAQVESLMSNDNWKLATERVLDLQRQWKEIGSVGRQRNEELWQRFRGACDKFFAAKKEYFDQQRSQHRERLAEEQENLKIKEEIIAKIEALDPADKENVKVLRALIAEYNAAGRVPYSKKDALYQSFRTAVDKQFDAMHLDASQRRIDSFREDLDKIEEKGENALEDEKRKLQRIYENIKQEIMTAENNIGFFARSKAENLLKEANRKIASLKNELRVIEEKINIIDSKLQ